MKTAKVLNAVFTLLLFLPLLLKATGLSDPTLLEAFLPLLILGTGVTVFFAIIGVVATLAHREALKAEAYFEEMSRRITLPPPGSKRV